MKNRNDLRTAILARAPRLLDQLYEELKKSFPEVNFNVLFIRDVGELPQIRGFTPEMVIIAGPLRQWDGTHNMSVKAYPLAPRYYDLKVPEIYLFGYKWERDLFPVEIYDIMERARNVIS